jgi:hypothetical protein
VLVDTGARYGAGSGVIDATTTMPRVGRPRSVAYGSPDGSTRPWIVSSGANGTFAATATVCWPGTAGGGDCSANQPGSGTKPSTAGSRAAVPDGAFSEPAVTPRTSATTSVAPTRTRARALVFRCRKGESTRLRARAVAWSSGDGSDSRDSRRMRSSSDDTFFLQHDAQLVLRACEPRRDGADREAEYAGDLLER